MTQTTGEVFDLGYQHYDGPREGRFRARTALWVNGVRTALGLGRGAKAKILPTLLFVAAMAPVSHPPRLHERLGRATRPLRARARRRIGRWLGR